MASVPIAVGKLVLVRWGGGHRHQGGQEERSCWWRRPWFQRQCSHRSQRGPVGWRAWRGEPPWLHPGLLCGRELFHVSYLCEVLALCKLDGRLDTECVSFPKSKITFVFNTYDMQNQPSSVAEDGDANWCSCPSTWLCVHQVLQSGDLKRWRRSRHAVRATAEGDRTADRHQTLELCWSMQLSCGKRHWVLFTATDCTEKLIPDYVQGWKGMQIRRF